MRMESRAHGSLHHAHATPRPCNYESIQAPTRADTLDAQLGTPPVAPLGVVPVAERTRGELAADETSFYTLALDQEAALT